MSNYERARKIVRLAATRVKDPSTHAWLLADERGTFEKLANEYLDKTAHKAAELGMPAEEVDDEIATVIGLNALTAQLEHRKKKGRKR